MRLTASGMSLASGAMASGKQAVSAVAPMAYDGLSYATAKSQQALNAGVDYGVQMARSAGSSAPPLYHGAMRGAQVYGVPAISLLKNGGVNATLAVGNGVGSVLSGLADVVEHGVPASRMVANGLGSATVALGNGVGQSLTGLANVAAEHGPPLAKAAMDGLAYQGSKAFHALYEAIKRLPAIPSLEMPYEGGNAMVSYQPIRNRRSNSPGRPSQSAADASAPTPATRHQHGPETKVFNTYDEWFAYAPGRAVLGEQLKLRPKFRSAASGKQATAKWLKSLTPGDMIQLLLMLDGKS